MLTGTGRSLACQHCYQILGTLHTSDWNSPTKLVTASAGPAIALRVDAPLFEQNYSIRVLPISLPVISSALKQSVF